MVNLRLCWSKCEEWKYIRQDQQGAPGLPSTYTPTNIICFQQEYHMDFCIHNIIYYMDLCIHNIRSNASTCHSHLCIHNIFLCFFYMDRCIQNIYLYFLVLLKSSHRFKIAVLHCWWKLFQESYFNLIVSLKKTDST